MGSRIELTDATQGQTIEVRVVPEEQEPGRQPAFATAHKEGLVPGLLSENDTTVSPKPQAARAELIPRLPTNAEELAQPEPRMPARPIADRTSRFTPADLATRPTTFAREWVLTHQAAQRGEIAGVQPDVADGQDATRRARLTTGAQRDAENNTEDKHSTGATLFATQTKDDQHREYPPDDVTLFEHRAGASQDMRREGTPNHAAVATLKPDQDITPDAEGKTSIAEEPPAQLPAAGGGKGKGNGDQEIPKTGGGGSSGEGDQPEGSGQPAEPSKPNHTERGVRPPSRYEQAIQENPEEFARALAEERAEFATILDDTFAQIGYTPPEGNVRILNIACGYGTEFPVLIDKFGGDSDHPEKVRIYAIDLDSERIQVAQEAASQLPGEHTVVLGDARKMGELGAPKSANFALLRRENVTYYNSTNPWPDIFFQTMDRLEPGGIAVVTSLDTEEHEAMLATFRSLGYLPAYTGLTRYHEASEAPYRLAPIDHSVAVFIKPTDTQQRPDRIISTITASTGDGTTEKAAELSTVTVREDTAARERVQSVYDYYQSRNDADTVRALEAIEAHRLSMFELTREEQILVEKPDAFGHPTLQKRTPFSQDRTVLEYFESSLEASSEMVLVKQRILAALEEPPLVTGDLANPVHKQITNRLRGVVAELPLDTLLPSENELTGLFGEVSRNTVRTVMQNLSTEGLVDKRRGAGSFVSDTNEQTAQPDNLSTKKGRILFVMRSLIESGELQVGDKLPTEEQLMTQFGVKRNTIREVLRKLREEKRVWTWSGKGSYIINPESFSDDQRLPFNEQIANSLRVGITTGVYQLGDKLPTERELADEWHVGLNTVREALQSLRGDELIFTWSGRGSFVINAQTLSAEDRLPLKEQVKHAIKLGLDSGVFEPDSDIPAVAVWQEGFGASKNTVLDAIHELEAEGFLTARQGGLPPIVAKPSVAGERQRPIPPPYQQVANALRERLRGQTKGYELATKEELAEKLHVSAEAITRGLRVLEEEGLVLIRGNGRRAIATGGQPISLEERLPTSTTIELNLRIQIAAKALRHGDSIPSERELADQYGTNVYQVQVAMDSLRTSGLIATIPGLGSTVVKK